MACQNSTGSAIAVLLETAEVVVEEAEDDVETRMLETGGGEGDVESSASVADETGDDAKLSTVGNSRAGNSRPSSRKDFEFDREDIKELSQEELASLWAACIIRNDDERQDECEMLRDFLLSVLGDENLFADLVVDSSAVPFEELVQVAMDRMLERGVRITMGVRGMMGQFLRQVQGKD